MKLLIVNILGAPVFACRLVFLFVETIALWIAEAADWCDDQCLETLTYLDPTKEDDQ